MSANVARIAARMAKLDASGIRKVFDLAAKMTDPINLSIGQPDFDVPAPVKAQAIAAIQSGFNKYTVTQGAAGLREAIAAACADEFGWTDDRPYLVTSGVSGALVLAYLVLVEPGDEVILLDPYFVMYEHLANLCGGKTVPVDTYPDFSPDPARIEAAITDRTRMLVVNSPCNPSGRVYGDDVLAAIADVAARHDLLVISDEIYNLFCYDQPFASLASHCDNTLLMRSFSKSYAMTGWRLGWCTGPAAIIEKMTMLQQYSFVCAPSVAQAAGVAAMQCDMSAQRDAYRHKRDMVYDALAEPFGLIKPGGAFYAFVPAPEGETGTEFVERAIAANVLIIPGNVFSRRDTHFRISYATSDEKLARGLDILAGLAR
ncbi:MAG TPA: aminotransferase class I/II-fold pyridoxal phosphate-dependent enzyme [Phycisphaerae bacterium]|nr:aminotransferase class I/II-fold pyridoxal phosphate-dependent enzyme [Phycisphaerae bacterium]HUU22522.1 aminotransferase class I/II-fold pyridoxal phosphate-dependent enzyme [Phycisphaerae bacterium]